MNYADKVHDLSFSFGKMLLYALVIFIVWGGLCGIAERALAETTRMSRESCKIVSINFTGVGATKDEGANVSIQTSCSFGKVTESSNNYKTVLEYALNRPSSIQCYQKKYQYSTVSRCDI